MCLVKEAMIAWGVFRTKRPAGYPEAVASLGGLTDGQEFAVKALFATLPHKYADE